MKQAQKNKTLVEIFAPKDACAMKRACLKIVEDEPICPGDMPDTMWNMIQRLKDDKHAMENVLRAIGSAMKKSLIDKIQQL